MADFEAESLRDRILKWIANQPPETAEQKAERERADRRALADFQDTSEEVLLYYCGDKESYVRSVLAVGRGSGFSDANDRVYLFQVNAADVRAIEELQQDALALSLEAPGDDRIPRENQLTRRAWKIVADVSVPQLEAWRGETAPDVHAVIGELPWQMIPKFFALIYAQRLALPRKGTP